MRYLVPAFAVTTSIESAPMRDVRETSVEIGAVAGRPAQHLARFSEPALSSHLLGAYDASTIRFELTGQVTPIHSPALVNLVGRVPGAPLEQQNRSQPTTSLSRPGSCMPPVGPRMEPRVEVNMHPASYRPGRRVGIKNLGVGVEVIDRCPLP